MISTTLLLLLSAVAQDEPKAKQPCEVRVYLVDKEHQAVAVNGISAVLVTQDPSGAEQPLPMTIVTAAPGGQKAPNCVLRARRVEGTSYTAALCAIAPEGRGSTGPSRDEGGGRDEEGIKVDFAAPYFKAVVPADHRCAPGCTMAIRFTLAGSAHSTRTFPCLAAPRSGAPTCCAAHQISAEIAELKRHLRANDRDKMNEALDRISACAERRDGSARTEQRRLDCVEAAADARAAMTSDFEEEALEAIERLQEKCEACFEACTSNPTD